MFSSTTREPIVNQEWAPIIMGVGAIIMADICFLGRRGLSRFGAKWDTAVSDRNHEDAYRRRMRNAYIFASFLLLFGIIFLAIGIVSLLTP